MNRMGSRYELILYILYIDVQSLPRSPHPRDRQRKRDGLALRRRGAETEKTIHFFAFSLRLRGSARAISLRKFAQPAKIPMGCGTDV
jgi:hypothetical protein